MICVPIFLASVVVIDLRAAFVAQKINAGVFITPLGVVIYPVLAFDFLDKELICQENLAIFFIWYKKF